MSFSQGVLFLNSKKSTLYTTLFIAFLDNMGVGLVYPLFAAMLFDQSLPLLPREMSADSRGLWLGILIALMPLAQFFSSPLWGGLSDGMGRKKPLLISVAVALLGYLVALWGAVACNIWLLCISRLIVGCAAGNLSIIQATLSDLSSKEEKTSYFGLYGMALGVGFTLGPFFGGVLSNVGYGLPFLFAFLLMGVNFLLIYFLFVETHTRHSLLHFKDTIHLGSLKKAFYFKGLRTLLFCSFLHNFGWSYFFEFTPVYLMTQLKFTSAMLGYFYAAAGGFYALSAGLLIQPFLKRVAIDKLFFWGNLLSASTILMMPLIPATFLIWPLLFLICFFVAFVSPSSTTFISHTVSAASQGEALGILNSVNAAALIISPLFSGSFVGKYPYIPMQVGGGVLLMTAGIFLIVHIFKRGRVLS